MSQSNVNGLKDLNEFLSQLAPRIEKNIMRGAMREGAKVVHGDAKQRIHNVSGQLAAGLKVSTGSKGGVVIAKVKTTGPHAHVGKWLEYGVAAHRIDPIVKNALSFNGVAFEGFDHPGVHALPFMRPALDAQQQAALLAVGEGIKKRLTKQGIGAAADVQLEAGGA